MGDTAVEPSVARANATGTDEPLPRQFGKYTLLRKLAAGGMAELFLALHRSVAGFEKLIVIKRILPSMNTDKGFIEMLLHEARIAATLSHPNIVQTFDVGQIEGTYFIAMEHIHGEDIRGIVKAMKEKKQTDFPLEHSLSIITGLCAGLAYAHEKRDLDGRLLDIVHRDISPQNIVVTFTGDVKIVDFGIAKSGVQTGEDTKGGQLKGKVPYMSPEQASGQEIDWRSDIFAAGVMLFELTTGKRLFKAGSEYETLKLICEKEYPKPSMVRPGYPPALEAIVMKALEKQREDRYQSAREMQGDLEAFAREEKVPCSQVGMTRWMQGLFAEKIAEQKEALQDVKQLADVIAAQQAQEVSAPPSEITSSGISVASVVGPQSTNGGIANTQAPFAQQRRAGSTAIWIALAGLALLGGAGFYYLKQQGDTRNEAANPAPPSSAAVVAEAKGSLDITSNPPGASIWIDGDLRPEVTPAKIEKLPFGQEIKIKLTMEGREAYRESVTLTDAQPTKPIQAEMKSGSVTVVLKVAPVGAAVWLDGKPWKGNLTKLEGLSADEEHKVMIAANGYVPKTVTVTAERGETKTITETLVKSSGANEGEKEKPSETKPASGGTATVRVNSKGGFCDVSINGTSYGPTPVQATVPAGNVRVTCKTTDGKTLSGGTTVAAGETGRVGFNVAQ